MPNRETHAIVGIIAGFVVGFIITSILGIGLLSGNFFIWIFMAIVGSLAPDLVEPGGKGKWDHRGFFHHKRLVKPVSIVSIILFPITFLIPIVGWILFFLIGYLTHLFLDSKTPMGLPD